MTDDLRLGVMFPGDEISCTGDDFDEWLDVVESAGFHHVAFGDHVVGVDPANAADGWDAQWPGPPGTRAYTYQTVYREPLVLFGYIAARTRLELVTGVLILPQRQAVLVAKQAAEVDILSQGRLRLGVGIGWNPYEYEALDMPFHRRGRLFDEQLQLLRRLWTEDTVTFEGEFHRVTASGLMTLPVQRPIPLWIGGDSRVALERVGRLGDGCFLTGRVTPDRTREVVTAIRSAADAAGRDADAIGLETRLVVGHRDNLELRSIADSWRRHGVTHICIDTRYAGRETLEDHYAAIRRAAVALQSVTTLPPR